MGGFCPLIETRPQTVEEKQVLTVAQSIGYDLAIQLQMLDAQGWINPVTAELAVETGRGLREGARLLKEVGDVG